MASPEAIRVWTEQRRLNRSPSTSGSLLDDDGLEQSPLIRAAFIGRTSTRDQQDPSLSLPRQLRSCQDALPEEVLVVAHFYDVESGRLALAQRGRVNSYEDFKIPIPRDGGIQDLLEEAERVDRRFDVVICESVERIARTTYFGTKIEHRLERTGVPLLASDEPIRLDTGPRKAKSATQVLTRRVKQGVAEWYVTEMLEKSWAGFEIHTEHGYNVGKPCYGYRALHEPHPVPAKRAKGVKKTRLEPHPVEGPVVRRIYSWRVAEHLGYEAIADRLNVDLITNPPPSPILAERTVGYWTSSSVRDVLTNPKHTGHMVWNRRARKGNGRNRPNPVEEWIWSPEPVHEALVDLETFVQAQQVAERRERSRGTSGVNKHPQAQRTYRLRSYMFCTSCGRRFYGKTSKDVSYYVCAPKKTYRPEGHPPSIWIKEDGLVDGLSHFLSTQVFGPYRLDLLHADLQAADTAQRHDRTERAKALRRAITEAETKRKRLVRNLEYVEEPDEELIRDMNTRRAELRTKQDDLQRQLGELEDQVRQAPNPALLSTLPISQVDLASLPDDLSRRLFEALRLEIHYDRTANRASCAITLSAETIDAVAQASHDSVVMPLQRTAPTPATHEEEGQMNSKNDALHRHPSVWCPRQDSNLRPSA